MEALQLILAAVLATAPSAATAEEFPLRAKYPDLRTVSTVDLAREIGKSVVIDVRSDFEYSVMRIAGAQHIDLSDPGFIAKLAAATGGDKARGIITYCNGTTCEKSYDAAMEAQRHGFTAVRVYDAGIFEWVRMARGRTLLLGKPIAAEDLISEQQFSAHLLEAAAFSSGAAGPDALLIDVRDATQRDQKVDLAMQAEWLPVDRLVQRLETPAFRSKAERKTLYIFDNVGKQVRWLQYALRANGYERYFFLKDGAAPLAAQRP